MIPEKLFTEALWYIDAHQQDGKRHSKRGEGAEMDSAKLSTTVRTDSRSLAAAQRCFNVSWMPRVMPEDPSYAMR